MITCSSNKKVYLTEDIAEEALIQAHMLFDYSKGGGPIAVYRCEDCGNYHLTSKGIMNSKLADYLKGGKLDRDKEAERWMRKLKGR
jgi:hypothetical protein